MLQTSDTQLKVKLLTQNSATELHATRGLCKEFMHLNDIRCLFLCLGKKIE